MYIHYAPVGFYLFLTPWMRQFSWTPLYLFFLNGRQLTFLRIISFRDQCFKSCCITATTDAYPTSIWYSGILRDFVVLSCFHSSEFLWAAQI